MTLIIAKIIDREKGSIVLVGDSKVTHRNNERLTKNSLVNPIQKVVIINDDVAVGFAGDNPDIAIRKLVELRRNSDEEIEPILQEHSNEKYNNGASTRFLVIRRKPTPHIVQISNGIADDRTSIGTGWIGDYEAFRIYTKLFQDLKTIPDPTSRFLGAIAHVIANEETETVGGHMVRASGSEAEPIRFQCDLGFMMPWNMVAERSQVSANAQTFRFTLPKGYDSTRNTRVPVPGRWPTFGALAHYIPELATAWLHTHERPWEDPVRIAARSVDELAMIAKAEHHQLLDARGIDAAINRNRGYPSFSTIRGR